MVKKLLDVETDHQQFDGAETSIVTLPPKGLADTPGAVTRFVEHGKDGAGPPGGVGGRAGSGAAAGALLPAAAWTITTDCPATTTSPARSSLPGFAATLTVTEPLPAPSAPALTVRN